MMVPRNIVGTGLFMLTLFLVACGSPADAATSLIQKGDPYGAKVGDLAPTFTLPTARGETVALENFRGRPVLLYFWASWCGSCTYDLPDIEKVTRQEAANDLVILTVNVGQKPEFVERYVRETVPDYSFIAATDTTLETFRRYRILSFPSSFFVDRQGTIRDMRVGRLSEKTIYEHLASIQ
ncbi:MAG: TlpA family protein disulfide reductase [Ardenticatenaceae bacterium]|nr:TlpA family protein disulfide reductase [Ardenticatenaceae bacterium]